MKKLIPILIPLLFGSSTLAAQNVGIGTNTPDASAKLEIDDANRGLLIPRVALTDVTNGTTPINAPATSLLVYNTNAAITSGNGEGFYYWDGTQWSQIANASDSDHDWYEVGTTTAPDDINNNIYTEGDVGIGENTPKATLDVDGDIIFGGVSSIEWHLRSASGRGILSSGPNYNAGKERVNFKPIGSTGQNFQLAIDDASSQLFPNYSFISDPNTGMFNRVSFPDHLYFSTNGVERQVIDDNGNVGIGTTTPETTVDVIGVSRSSTGTISGNTGHVAFRAPGNIGAAGNTYLRIGLPLNALQTAGDKGYTIKMYHKNYLQASYAAPLLSEDIILFNVSIVGNGTPTAFNLDIEADKLQSSYEYDHTFDLGNNMLYLNIRPTVSNGAGRTSAIDLHITSRNNSAFDQTIIREWVEGVTSSLQTQGSLSTQTVQMAVANEWLDNGTDPVIYATQARANGNDVVVTDAGSVGIGTNNPFGPLHILNPTSYSSDNAAVSNSSIVLYGAVTNSIGSHFGGITWASSSSRKRAGISSVMENADSDYLGLAFWTQGTDGPGPMSESMRISHAGNVGIGTTTPQDLLNLASASPELVFTDITANDYGSIHFQDGTFEFYTNTTTTGQPSVNGTEVLTITKNGNIGIGETVPDARLHVTSGGNAANNYTAKFVSSPSSAGAGGIVFTNTEAANATGFKWHTTSTGVGTGADDDLVLSNINVNSGTANLNNLLVIEGNGNATLAGTLTQSSDQRLKTNITALSSSLSNIMQLSGYTYTWKDTEQKGTEMQIGVLAQEVEAFYPALIREDANGYLSVNYSGLVPVLIEATKEQQTTIESQEAIIEEQARKIAELEANISVKDASIEQLESNVSDMNTRLERVESLLEGTAQD